MTTKLPYTDTYPAGEFVCDNCGKNSYFSLVSINSELDEEELSDFFKKVFGNRKASKEATGVWLLHPVTVKCQHCNMEYSTYQNEMES